MATTFLIEGPGVPEKKAREIADRYGLEESAREFLIDFASRATQAALKKELSDGEERDSHCCEAKLRSDYGKKFGEAFSELKDFLWLIVS